MKANALTVALSLTCLLGSASYTLLLSSHEAAEA